MTAYWRFDESVIVPRGSRGHGTSVLNCRLVFTWAVMIGLLAVAPVALELALTVAVIDGEVQVVDEPAKPGTVCASEQMTDWASTEAVFAAQEDVVQLCEATYSAASRVAASMVSQAW